MAKRFTKAEKLANYTRDLMKCRKESVGPFTLDVELAKSFGWPPERIALLSRKLTKLNVDEWEHFRRSRAS